MHRRVCSAAALLVSIIIIIIQWALFPSLVSGHHWMMDCLQAGATAPVHSSSEGLGLAYLLSFQEFSLLEWVMVVLYLCSEIWYLPVLCPVLPYLGPVVQWFLLNAVVLLSAPGRVQPENSRQPAIGIFSKLCTSKVLGPFLALSLPCSN